MEPRSRTEPARAGARGWRRTFWVVFASNLISGAGLMSFLPFFPTLLEGLGVADEHARAVWSGILFGAAPLSAGFTGPLWGSIGDRYGRKLMVVRSLLGLALFVGLMSFARSAWELLFLRIGQGVVSGYMAPSLTLVSVAAPRDRQGRVTSWIQTASTLGTIVGPMIGALLLATTGMRTIFTGTAVAAATSAALVWFLAVEEGRPRVAGARFAGVRFEIVAVLRSSWRDLVALLANPRVRQGIALYAAVHFALGATNPLMEFLVEEVWRGDPARIEGLTGTLFSTLALAAIVATPLWGRLGDRLGHGVALRLASVLSAAALVLHALVPSFAWLFGVRLAFGLASPGASASAFGLAAVESSDEQRGAAMGAVFSARCFALSAGSFLAGSLTAALGIRGLFAVAGAAIGLGLLTGRAREGQG
jgi:MFS transporter, DHA1 family, multidrug resistance protein